ncbi:protein kinase domain-containing protein [Deinococcus geothermalis]|uniref:protein kinase domain-containing protein n=1 Tax=Deinococcus geothermalis TaxID=68909 RepID=UPI00059D03B2|nr:protein kinase [Deinococcus geothermalis]
MPNQTIDGRYTILETLKKGAHVYVHHAYDTEQGEDVILKVFRNDADEPIVAAAMFQREMGALERLNHPNIIRKHRSFETDSGSGISLEYIPGSRTLANQIKQAKPALIWRIKVLQETLDALKHAHGEGVIHRDISLNNLLWDSDEDSIKLSDFGIAKLKGAAEVIPPTAALESAPTLAQFGSPPFTAPEQLRYQEPDTRSDLYSFAVLMVAVLTWQILPKSFTQDRLTETLAPLATELPPASYHKLLAFLRDALEDKPEHRPSVFEFQEELQRLGVDLRPTPRVGLRLTKQTTQDLQARELTRQQLADDFNDNPKAFLQEIEDRFTGDLTYQIKLYGRSAMATLRPEPENVEGDERLYVSSLIWPDPEQHAFNRARTDDVHVQVYFMDRASTPAHDFLTALRTKFEEREAEKTQREERRKYLAIPRRIVNFEKSQLNGLKLRYQAAEKGKKRFLKVQKDTSFHVTVTSLERYNQGNIQNSDAPEQPLAQQFKQALQADLSGRANAYLEESNYAVGRYENFRTKDNRLTLSSFKKQRLPEAGTLLLVDPASYASVARKEQALDAFEQGDYSNPQLAARLMTPYRNQLNASPPLEPLQDLLKQNPENYRLLGRVVAAEDLFLIQGPPGTGKTTLIVDLIGQLLKAKPYGRILVTSQSNKAVDVVLKRLAKRFPEVRYVRIASEYWQSDVPTFDDSFAAWRDLTRNNAEQAMQRYQPAPGENAAAVQSALQDWVAHLNNGMDLQPQFVEGISVVGVLSG